MRSTTKQTQSAPLPLFIRDWRKVKGLSQSELGSLTGMDKRQISRLETGGTKRPYDSTLQAIADALRLSVYDLYRSPKAHWPR